MNLERLQQNWDDFIYRGLINPDVQPSVAKSWRKCRQHGIDPNGGQGILVSPEVFESIRAANQELIDAAMPVMLSIFDIVASSHFLMVLTDSAGYVLETIGDQAIAEAADDLRFKPGSKWSDTEVGTNALSVCLDYDIAIQMLGPEHYCISHQGWVCSAAPIHGLNGEVAGCLNMSGAKAAVHPHTLGMAKAAAFAIEQQMLASHNKQMMHASLHRTVNILSGNNANRSFADILEASPGLRGTVAIAERFASYDGTVYLNGEVGTGKEFFAQAIHNASSRAAGPFVVVNCASLPRVSVESELFGSVETYAGEEAGEKGERGERGERGARGERGEGGYPGKLELANLGTVYLQEIAELPLEYQAELLQVLESRTVKRIGSTQARHLDVRIIASSSRNLRGEVEAGRFRNDLFVFINVLRIDLSPLRERPDDILVCAKRALEYFNQRYPENRKTMSDAFISRLVSYHWPGNTKELQNCIERSFYASTDNILDEHLLDGLAGDGLDLQSLSDAAYSNAAMQAGYYGASVQIGQPLPASQNGFVGQMGLGGLLGQPAKGSLLGQPAKFAINVSDNHEYIEIVNALRVNDFDVGKAAFAIGMSRATLYRHIAKLQINVKALRAATRSYGLRRRA